MLRGFLRGRDFVAVPKIATALLFELPIKHFNMLTVEEDSRKGT